MKLRLVEKLDAQDVVNMCSLHATTGFSYVMYFLIPHTKSVSKCVCDTHVIRICHLLLRYYSIVTPHPYQYALSSSSLGPGPHDNANYQSVI